METNKIFNEACLDTLRAMPDDYLDCVITSPPYYGMRNYGTNAQIWGGEPDCTHTWGKHLRHPNFDSRSPEEKRRQGGTVGNNLETAQNSAMSGGNFCMECNAWKGELGSEPNVLLFIENLTTIFREIYRVTKPTGTVWVNLDDSYNSGGNVRSGPDQNGSRFHTTINRSRVGYVKTSTAGQPVKRKSMFNVPARFAISMTDDVGFVQRNLPIWQKDSVSPESVKDRFTHEYETIFFYTKKSTGYFFQQQLEPYRGIKQKRSEKVLDHQVQLAVPYNRAGDGDPNGRNMRDVWRINTEPQAHEHYASYPTKLVERMLKAGCPIGGLVYDPFTGSGTTQLVAYRYGAEFLGSELNPFYHKLATERLRIEMEKGRLF